jgi:hypothetical protein
MLDESLLLFLFAAFLVYHLLKLRGDTAFTQDALVARQQAFPVLIFDRGDGKFSRQMIAVMKRHASQLPVEIVSLSENIPKVKNETARVAILPTGLLTDPPDGLHRWLKKFLGHKILAAETVSGWILSGLTPDQAAQAARQVAEGQQVRISPTTSPGMIVLYTLLALVVLVVLLTAFDSIFYLF